MLALWGLRKQGQETLVRSGAVRIRVKRRIREGFLVLVQRHRRVAPPRTAANYEAWSLRQTSGAFLDRLGFAPGGVTSIEREISTVARKQEASRGQACMCRTVDSKSTWDLQSHTQEMLLWNHARG